MRMLVAFIMALAVAQGVEAKGRASSSGALKTQHVDGYTRADGTHVNGYWRSPGQHPAGAPGGVSGGGPVEDDTGWAHGMGRQQSDDPKGGGCVYKDVMTDADLAECRH